VEVNTEELNSAFLNVEVSQFRLEYGQLQKNRGLITVYPQHWSSCNGQSR